MWRYDLHVHSSYSPDGKSSLEAIIRRAEQMGLSGIAITDHDTLKGAFAAQRFDTCIEIIPGCEISLDDGSHIIGLYLHEMIQSKRLEDVVTEIHGQGGLVMIPHPFKVKSGLLHKMQQGKEQDLTWLLQQADFIEVYNPGCSLEENHLARKLAECYDGSIIPIASSDAHRAWQIGAGQLILYNWRSIDHQGGKANLRHLLTSEGTYWDLYVGRYDSVLLIHDPRPQLVRLRQLLKLRFPISARLWQQLRRVCSSPWLTLI